MRSRRPSPTRAPIARGRASPKRTGAGSRKAGNAWLKWAFSEAAVLSAQKDERMIRCLATLQSRHASGKGLSIFAHKLGRVVDHMLRTTRVFDADQFVRG